MTDLAEVGAELSVPAQLWVPGTAVVALGSDGGGDAVAVWQVSPQGAPTGAWVVPVAEAFGDEAAARRLMALLERRGVTGVATDEVERVLEQVTRRAGLGTRRWWAEHLFSPVVAFNEILIRRDEVERVIGEARANKNVAELEWPNDLTGYTVAELEDVRRVARLGVAGEHVGDTAILVSRVLSWLAGQWATTEQVKNRRGYVRDALGEPQALPPSWLAAVQTASATVLPL